MVVTNEASPAALGALKLRVEGMDCGTCALKIENALKRLPGVSEINVNYSSETLTLSLDEDRTSRTAIEDKIRTLGYTPRPLQADRPPASEKLAEEHDDAASKASWYQTRKARLVVTAGALLASAFVIAEGAPPISFWAYLVAALIGLVPVARRRSPRLERYPA